MSSLNQSTNEQIGVAQLQNVGNSKFGLLGVVTGLSNEGVVTSGYVGNASPFVLLYSFIASIAAGD